MSITSNANSTFLNVDNAHLRVSGDIHATAVKVGAIEIVPGYSLESTTGIGNTTPHTVEFTNTETSLVTSGDINMLHSSNNATIKLNSNVVTEFPRSKKLIKYPRVALTQNDESGTSGYVASASRENGVRQAYTAFDGDDTTFWQIVNNPDRYDTSGNATSDATLFEGNNGEWIKILLPTKVNINSIRRRATGSTRRPTKCKFYGSNNDTTWHLLEDITFSNTDWADETVNTNNYYNYFVLQVLTVSGNGQNVDMKELELYGIPEYDPDAHGVDVKVTSYPNVPNTDWLEVYYDAKDLADGAVTSVDDLTPSGTNDGTANGGVTVSDGAFVFNGNQYIQGDTGLTGNFIHSVSMWFNANNDGQLFWTGINANSGDRMNIFFSEDGGLGGNTTTPQIHYTFKGHTHYANVNPNQWYHLVCTYSGIDSSYRKIYLNGVETGADTATDGTGDTTHALNIQDSTFYINKTNYSNGSLVGKIANFRLFNRSLSQDEVWQLYAYQKEYFGHGDLSMTLKAGRLGIGTSEPMSLLQVGDEPFGPGSRPMFRAVNNSASTLSYDATQGAKIFTTEFDTAQINITNSYSTSTGRFTAPISGYYFFEFQLLAAIAVGHWGTIQLSFYKNGVNVNQADSGRGLSYLWVNNPNISNPAYAHLNTPSCRAILYLNRGEYVQAGYPGISSSTASSSFEYSKNYAFFQGYLLST